MQEEGREEYLEKQKWLSYIQSFIVCSQPSDCYNVFGLPNSMYRDGERHVSKQNNELLLMIGYSSHFILSCRAEGI
jgi:hypothetical protein